MAAHRSCCRVTRSLPFRIDASMDQDQLKDIAAGLLDGTLTVEAFVQQLTRPATADLKDAQIDLDRESRCGFAEVVFGEGKSHETLERIFQTLLSNNQPVLATRIDERQAAFLIARFPTARHNPLAGTLRIEAVRADNRWPHAGKVAIVAAGTSDLPVAEEAKETAEWTGADVIQITDVGVAGPQRLPRHLSDFKDTDAIVVVAGMEGALPSVVGGHVACPVIAVPTSVGYGTNFGGLTALLSMLNSCAANVTVVNIDAGFKAGYLAGLIAQRAAYYRGVSHDLRS